MFFFFQIERIKCLAQVSADNFSADLQINDTVAWAISQKYTFYRSHIAAIANAQQFMSTQGFFFIIFNVLFFQHCKY